jgi:hypothetical protein
MNQMTIPNIISVVYVEKASLEATCYPDTKQGMKNRINRTHLLRLLVGLERGEKLHLNMMPQVLQVRRILPPNSENKDGQNGKFGIQTCNKLLRLA